MKTPAEQGRVTIDLKEVHLWHGRRNPYLYTVEVQLLEQGEILDAVQTRIGFRTFRMDPNRGFILNGEEYPPRGVSRHQDRWGVGNALFPEHHKEDMELIRELGATTVRLAHYQQDQCVYDLCDEMGLIVWAEIPYISRHLENGVENTLQQMRELKKTPGEINHLLMDPDVELLGPYGGITTMNNRKFRYPVTVLAAVLSYLWIEMCIERIQLEEELKNPCSDELLFAGYQGNLQQQEALLKLCLRNGLYSLEDDETTINYFPIISRWSVTDAIEQLRRERKTEYSPMVEVVQNVLRDFCLTAEQDAEELYQGIS